MKLAPGCFCITALTSKQWTSMGIQRSTTRVLVAMKLVLGCFCKKVPTLPQYPIMEEQRSTTHARVVI